MTMKATTERLELEYPIEYKGALIKELTLRRPKGNDMRWLPKGGADVSLEQMYPFFALLAGVEEAVFDEMDAADIAAYGEIVNGFMSKPAKRKR